MPEEFIQIDHQMPQSTGKSFAMAKVLHTVADNLTLEQGHGRKALAYKDKNGRKIFPKKGMNWAKGWVSAKLEADQDKLRRYTFRGEGEIVLSLGIAWYGLTGFADMCMNNKLNLVPSCPLCNQTKTNISFAKREA